MHHKMIKMMPHGHCMCLQLICTSQFLMFAQQLSFYVAWLHTTTLEGECWRVQSKIQFARPTRYKCSEMYANSEAMNSSLPLQIRLISSLCSAEGQSREARQSKNGIAGTSCLAVSGHCFPNCWSEKNSFLKNLHLANARKLSLKTFALYDNIQLI